LTDIIRLTDSDIKALNLSYDAIIKSLRDGFVSLDEASSTITPKVAARGVQTGFFHAMPAIYDDLAVVKWVASGYKPKDAYLYAHAIASDRATGEPKAFLDFSLGTGLRTAAISALGTDILAAPESRQLSMVGLGLQARTHLDALLAVRPFTHVVACGRTEESCRAYADFVKERGLTVRTILTPDADFYSSDVIVSALPLRTPKFLDADQVGPGRLVLAVDLGNAWTLDGLQRFDHLSCDNRLHYRGTMSYHPSDFHDLDFHDDLTSLTKRGYQWQPDRRAAFVPPGMAFSDAILIKLILNTIGGAP
jgi:ornithine cyclodeaminase/alanine dehydrogenase-like protein (mu-crystallin family)